MVDSLLGSYCYFIQGTLESTFDGTSGIHRHEHLMKRRNGRLSWRKEKSSLRDKSERGSLQYVPVSLSLFGQMVIATTDAQEGV